MLLQRLREYSERRLVAADLPPAGYAFVNVGYVIDLNANGTHGSVSTLETDGTPPRRGRRLAMPQTATKTSGVVALPFFGNGQYVLGLLREKSNRERARREHAAFRDTVEEYAASTGHPDVEVVRQFYRAGAHELLSLPAAFTPDDTLTFRVEDRWITALPEVQRQWQQRSPHQAGRSSTRSSAAPQEPPNVMQCVVCGEKRPVTRIIEGKIKGIPGGQSAGTALISANREAFTSYGLPSSLIAPTCASCGDSFTKALNHLLANESTRVRFADSVYVFWTREPESDWNPFALLNEASPEDVRTLLQSLHTGRRAAVDPNRFYAVALSAAGGRAVVRDWIDVTLPEAQDALATWFARQAIVDAATGATRYFGLRALGGATVRDLREISPPTTRALLRCALTGGAAPQSLLAAAVRRTQAERRVTAAHASLIKLVLVSATDYAGEEHDMTALQPEHPSPGYQCGRLMAVLESVQRAALPGVKAGIVDRYFGSASSSPASVFSRLVRGAQPHLGVLERDRPAVQRALQGRLEQVLDQLPSFPRVLTLQEQGLFALGYYHQRADDRARMRIAAERKRAGTASAKDLAETEMDDEEDD